ncbi:MAG: S8 family serine peptidase [Candidatus Sericytochromatia bacterium]
MVWLRILIIAGLCLLTACQKTGPNGNNWLGSSSSGDFSIAHLRRELKPLVACVKPNFDGSFTAYFGYQNTTGKTITLPVGEKNKFLENPGRESNFDKNEDYYSDAHNDRDKGFSTKSTQKRDDDNKKDRDQDREDEHQNNRRDYQDRGQPTVFPVGNSPAWPNNPLAIRFNAERISWKLDQQTVTSYANDSSQRCKIEQITVPQQTPVRKNILPAQTLHIIQRNSSSHTLSFNIAETADLKRRILVNIINGPNGSPRVNQADIFVNKQPLNINLNTQTPDNIKQVFTAHSGTNTLEIELNGVIGSSVEVSIEGLMDPIYIPGAMFSDIPDSPVVRAMEHNKHLVGLKFMEGMRVRIQNGASGSQEFTDLTGISLTPLNRLLPSLTPRLIYPALSKSPEEQEQTEIRTQNFFGVETINTSLMYQLEFSAEQDVWAIIDQLRQLPFIEEAFPTILPVQASDTSTPDDEYLKSTHSYIENSDGPTRPALSLTYHTWLRNTRVMSDPVAGTDGSWLYTKGNPNVKIAVLDSGIQHQGLKGVAKTHEDFFNKQGINPIQVLSNLQQDKIPSEYTHLDHGTPAVGIISAQGDNKIGNAALAKGTAGIAYEAKMIFVQSYGEYTNPAKPKERIGIPANCLNRYSVGKPEYCEPAADAMELLRQHHPDIKVVVLEVWNGIGTAEMMNPAIRALISDFVSAGIAVVVPAGNSTCDHIHPEDGPSQKKEFDECSSLYSAPTPEKPLSGADISKHIAVPQWYTPAGTSSPRPLNLAARLQRKGIIYELPWPDFGSIIVGGVRVDGKTRQRDDYNHGISHPATAPYRLTSTECSNPAAIYTTDDGHGTDVSGPADHIWTTGFKIEDPAKSDFYTRFNGTSGASPIVGGVIAQMLSVNPNLKPLEIRRILRCTAQSIAASEHIAGMVNAYEAVKMANGGKPPANIGFTRLSLLPPPPGATPGDHGLNAFYDPNSTTPITARAGDMIGFYTANARTRNISIEIQGQNAVLTAVDDHLLTMTVPANLVVGNLDVLFKSADGEFKIENLINYTSPFPEVVKFSKPTIFANGGDVVDGYITVKDANGQPAPDGTPYYVQLVPTQLGLYPDLTMIHPETGQQYGGRWTTVEQVLPVKNGKIHIQAKLNAPIAPYEYTYDFSNSLPNVFTWPHANAPSFQVQVCNPAYNSNKPGYGYYCGQQLFPQAGNTLDGRLYAVHAYSFDPQIQHVTAGSPKRTITIRNIKDILGNPVPVGTHLHFNQTYYGNVSNPNGNDIYWGVAVTTPGEVDIVYEPFQRITCGLVGVEEYVYITTVQGAVGNPLHWLVGNPIYFRYVAC